MIPPVIGIDGRILNRVAAVNHHAITNIDSYVTGTGCLIGSLEKDQVTWLRLIPRNSGAAVIEKSISSLSSIAPSITTMIDDVAYKT